VSSPPSPPGEIEIDPALEPANADTQNFATPADAVAPIAAEILQHLLTGMRFRGRITRHEPEEEAAVNAGDDEPAVVLNVTGLNDPDQQLLIGRRGESLAALQFMVNLLLGAKTDLWARVVIDVDGYRVKRREALTLLAERMAERVIEQGQAYPLEPMSPYDRRIVHMALAEHPQVMTESTGEGDERRVVIMLRR
jgi:spoIIIJ-associated protein